LVLKAGSQFFTKKTICKRHFAFGGRGLKGHPALVMHRARFEKGAILGMRACARWEVSTVPKQPPRGP